MAKSKKEKQIDVSVAEVVDYMRINGTFLPALRDVVERKLVVEAAAKKGLKVTKGELQKAADAFRVVNGLNKAKDTEVWLSSRGITVEGLEEYLETNLLMSKFKDQLEAKTAKTKYHASPGVKEGVRNMIFQDWLAKQMK
jgi:hypothetical protein